MSQRDYSYNELQKFVSGALEYTQSFLFILLAYYLFLLLSAHMYSLVLAVSFLSIFFTLDNNRCMSLLNRSFLYFKSCYGLLLPFLTLAMLFADCYYFDKEHQIKNISDIGPFLSYMIGIDDFLWVPQALFQLSDLAFIGWMVIFASFLFGILIFNISIDSLLIGYFHYYILTGSFYYFSETLKSTVITDLFSHQIEIHLIITAFFIKSLFSYDLMNKQNQVIHGETS